jgi:hypothetical protein
MRSGPSSPSCCPPPASIGRPYPRHPARADVSAAIDKLIDNLVNIKDETGEFLLRLEDGRIIDTKGWAGWEWTHGVGLFGMWRYFEQTGDERRWHHHQAVVRGSLRRRHADQEHQHDGAVHHAGLSVRAPATRATFPIWTPGPNG